ncbi:MAG: hypothetical protein IGBAC_0346 [Ignavibacteriae bacterium]|nr:MAG: hypothetical protein IGBAC_0346 [Ignavibacteriota bacterium]
MAGIYIHIPFCQRKCVYCDFYSLADNKDFDIFISFLLKEINLYSEKYRDENFSTIYLGGGTPSILDQSQVETILKEINKSFQLSTSPEVTIEVNPGTVNEKKLKAYRNSGINRISIGVQSFMDEDLKFLNRIHNSEEARKCIIDALNAGFENVSIDLIYALPTQTISTLENNLTQAISYPLKHISAYSLIIEQNTPLASMVRESKIKPVPEELEAMMMEFVINFLTQNGFKQYEVSNFAKSGYESKHNLNYWNHSNYIGCGPSAHSFWNWKRWWNVDTIFSYYSRLNNNLLPVADSEELTETQIINEMLFLGLRNGGIDFKKMNKMFNKDFIKPNIEEINKLVEDNFATFEQNILRLTTKGYLITDEIVSKLAI